MAYPGPGQYQQLPPPPPGFYSRQAPYPYPQIAPIPTQPQPYPPLRQPFQEPVISSSFPQQMPMQQPYQAPPVPAQPISHTHVSAPWRPKRRTNPMQWNLAESLDVEQMVRMLDTRSIEYFTNQFMNSNITSSDFEKFGSKGALNAFLVLQIGCDYLMHQLRQKDAEMSVNASTQAALADQQLVQQYNEYTEAMKKALEERDAKIKQLNLERVRLSADLSKAVAACKQLKKKYHRHSKKAPKPEPTFTDSEPGLAHDQTKYLELQKEQRDYMSKPPPKYVPDDELSEGQIQTVNPTDLIPDDEEEEEYVFDEGSDGEIDEDEY